MKPGDIIKLSPDTDVQNQSGVMAEGLEASLLHHRLFNDDDLKTYVRPLLLLCVWRHFKCLDLRCAGHMTPGQ